MVGLISKNPSILKKFLFINFIIFFIIGLLTIFYLQQIEPSLIKKKSLNHFRIINNTIDHVKRLEVNFNKEDINQFLTSTRFLFQNLDRVLFFNNEFFLIGDTDTLDLDARSFSRNFSIIEEPIGTTEKNIKIVKENEKDKKLNKNYKILLQKYSNSKNLDKIFTQTKTINNNFNVITIKNIKKKQKNIGYIIISEHSNEIRAAIKERENFILRTVFITAILIIVFSFVLNKYFLRPIKNLVDYTKAIKEKDIQNKSLENFIKRKDELGQLSNSLKEMTTELYKRVNIAETFSTDLVHEIRNPLASLKSASEIIEETEDEKKRSKLIKIISHDVQRIERLITDYSQMLKDEATLSMEKMKKVDIVSIVKSVIEDFNNLPNPKNITVLLEISKKDKKLFVLGLSNRIEQILANLLDNAISFSPNNSQIKVSIGYKNKLVSLTVEDEGQGFNEKNTEKIFQRFYSNRPEKFGEHSGLGLNIVKNLVEIHGGQINASNKLTGKGAKIDISLPEMNIN